MYLQTELLLQIIDWQVAFNFPEIICNSLNGYYKHILYALDRIKFFTSCGSILWRRFNIIVGGNIPLASALSASEQDCKDILKQFRLIVLKMFYISAYINTYYLYELISTIQYSSHEVTNYKANFHLNFKDNFSIFPKQSKNNVVKRESFCSLFEVMKQWPLMGSWV